MKMGILTTMSNAEKKNIILSFAVSESEYKAITSKAQEQERSLSQYIRRELMKNIKGE